MTYSVPLAGAGTAMFCSNNICGRSLPSHSKKNNKAASRAIKIIIQTHPIVLLRRNILIFESLNRQIAFRQRLADI